MPESIFPLHLMMTPSVQTTTSDARKLAPPTDKPTTRGVRKSASVGDAPRLGWNVIGRGGGVGGWECSFDVSKGVGEEEGHRSRCRTVECRQLPLHRHAVCEHGRIPDKTLRVFEEAGVKGVEFDGEFLKRYLVGEPLGRGATAVVVAAVRVRDGLDVAVKFIFKDKIPPTAWKRDRTHGIIPIEAFILKRISHKNIVRFLDVYEDPNFFYLVMEAAHPIHSAFAVVGGEVDSPPSPTAVSLMETLNWARELGALGEGCEGNTSFPLEKGKAYMPLEEGERGRRCPGGEEVRPTTVTQCASRSSSSSSSSSSSTLSPSPRHRSSPLTRRRRTHGSPMTAGGGLQRRPSQDLFDVIERNPWMPERTVRYIFTQVVSAVAHLHAMGYVHRDIKDENVIIDERLGVKLIDFGTARAVPASRGEYFDEFCGTLMYCPPELVGLARAGRGGGGGGGKGDGGKEEEEEEEEKGLMDEREREAGGRLYRYRGPEQDVFSLGVLLYILLTATPPYSVGSDRRERPAALARWVVHDGDASSSVGGGGGGVKGAGEEAGGGGGWGSRSARCRDLVWRMLEPEPLKRIDVAGVLRHGWVATTEVE
ncbi:hypothetical protein HDU67_009535 [Dinochytrium kinnereticum]|nr:hypothetical protein HDU67_009535 [Dinochytrium kinnereticum]